MSDSNLTTDPKFTTDQAAQYLGGEVAPISRTLFK